MIAGFYKQSRGRRVARRGKGEESRCSEVSTNKSAAPVVGLHPLRMYRGLHFPAACFQKEMFQFYFFLFLNALNFVRM